MKLHLPKQLFTALLAVFTLVAPAVHALTLTDGYHKTYSLSENWSYTVNGTTVSYTASTGILENYDMNSKTLSINLNTSWNQAGTVIAINPGENSNHLGSYSVGLYAQTDGSLSDIAGTSTDWGDGANITASRLLEEGAQTTLTVKSHKANNFGTYITAADGDQLYKMPGLRYSNGEYNKTYLNSSIISAIVVTDIESGTTADETKYYASNFAGTWEQQFAKDTTLAVSSLSEITSGTDLTDKRAIVVGSAGQLWLNAAAASLSLAEVTDIYIGNTSYQNSGNSAYNLSAVRFENANAINVSGDLYIVDNAAMISTGSAEVSFAGTVTDKVLNSAGETVSTNSTLSLSGTGYNFTGAVDVTGLHLAAGTEATFCNLTVGNTLTNNGTVLGNGSVLNLRGSSSLTNISALGSGSLNILGSNGDALITMSGAFSASSLGLALNSNTITYTHVADQTIGGSLTIHEGAEFVAIGGGDGITNNWDSTAITVDGGTLKINGTRNFGASVSVINGGTYLVGKGDAHRENASNTITVSTELECDENGDYILTDAEGRDVRSQLSLGANRMAFGSNTKIVLDNGRVTGAGDNYGGLDFYGANTLTSSGTSEVEGIIRLRNNLTVDVTSGELTVNRFIANSRTTAYTLTKTGAGTLVITQTGNNSQGEVLHNLTSVQKGTLALDGAGTFGMGKVTVAAGATVEFRGATDKTISNVIEGGGNLNKMGTGTVTLSGAVGTSSTALGSISVTGGELKLSSASPAYIGTVSVSDGSKLNFNGVNATISGAVTLGSNANLTVGSGSIKGALNFTSDGASLTQSGEGILNLTGGVSIAQNVGATLTGKLGLGSTITNNGTLTLSGSIELLGELTSFEQKDPGSSTYSHDNENGFYNVSSAQYWLTSSGGTLKDTLAENISITRGEAEYETGIENDKVYFTTSGDIAGTVFFVTTNDSVTGVVSVDAEAAAKASGYTLRGGTMQLESGATTKAGAVVTATSAGTINLAAGSTLNSFTKEGSGTITLTGSGTYNLGRQAITSGKDTLGSISQGLSLGADWNGTVKLGSDTTLDDTGHNFNFDDFVNIQSGVSVSTVELEGVTGYLGQGMTTCASIRLTGEGLEITNTYSSTTYTFNGSISGLGKLTIGKNLNSTFTFNGDTSGWTGSLVQTTGIYTYNFNGGSTIANNFESSVASENFKVNVSNAQDVSLTGTLKAKNAAGIQVERTDSNGNLSVKSVELEGTGSVKIQGLQLSATNTSEATAQTPASVKAKADTDGALTYLAQEASFTIQDMTLTNTTITAAETRVNLSNVSASNLALAAGKFTMNAAPVVGLGGGTEATLNTGVSSLTAGAATLTLDLDMIGAYESTGAVSGATLTITLGVSGADFSSYTVENWQALVGFDQKSWLGQALVDATFTTGTVAPAEAGSSAPTVSYGYASGGSNVGTLTITITGLNVPEPTTATLSLLALAALAARRRRQA